MAKGKSNPKSVGTHSEIRKHYFLDRYVIIAAGRSLRPEAPTSRGEDHTLEKPGAPAIEAEPAIVEIPGPDGKWAVKVIANKYPALSTDWPKGFGEHEIVVETPRHSIEFSELPVSQIELILEAYRRRLATLSQLRGIRYVCVFKNDGRGAGASLGHAHSQILALPLVPPQIELETKATAIYREQHGRCPLCDALEWEERQAARLIYSDKNIVAFAPYASSAGYEAWILPRTHRRRLADLTAAETHSLATVLKLLTAKVDSIQLSYNFFLQESLPEAEDHFVIKLQPRWSTWAGLELATGVMINTVPPEQAALWYKSR
jgi:UDPglucose--hexose-1-phosphate uridylyltransferase